MNVISYRHSLNHQFYFDFWSAHTQFAMVEKWTTFQYFFLTFTVDVGLLYFEGVRGSMPVNSIQTITVFTLHYKYVCTWIIERDQYVGGGLLLGSPLTVNDVKGNSLSLSYVIAHTACGVNDKTQHRGLGEAHQSTGTGERQNTITLSC